MSGLDRDQLIQVLLIALVRRMPEQKAVVTKDELDNRGSEALALHREGEDIHIRVIQSNKPPGWNKK